MNSPGFITTRTANASAFDANRLSVDPVLVGASTCNATTLHSNVSTATVSSSSVATTNTPLTICARSSATLTATTSAGRMARFYSTATGGTALTSATAGSYTTPVLTASTTYHAAAVSSSSESVGPPAFNSTPPPQIGHALYFTTTGPTTIASVTVYLNAGQVAGTVTIALNKGTAPANLVNGQRREPARVPQPHARRQPHPGTDRPQAKASQLTVLNSLGQMVHTRLLPTGTAKLNLAHLAAGVYTLQVQTPEGMLTQRIVRE